MGRGLIKRKNNLKKEYMAPLRKYAEELERENHALKNDPQSLVGQFISGYRELQTHNSRLSVLAACLIKKLGPQVRLTKEEMESFKGNRINIRWELPEGVLTPEESTEYVFSYDLVPEPVALAPEVAPDLSVDTIGDAQAEDDIEPSVTVAPSLPADEIVAVNTPE
jgi:hypothetical protein